MNNTLSSPIPQCFSGSCHCGSIQFQIWVKDFTVLSCNCSICQKKGFLHLIVPPEQFELLQGSESLQTYTFNTATAQHHFCKTCGIAPFYRPRSHPTHYDINLRCIDDEPLETLLQHFDLQAFDGRQWEQNIHQITEIEHSDPLTTPNAKTTYSENL
jgi:hypothetical protein